MHKFPPFYLVVSKNLYIFANGLLILYLFIIMETTKTKRTREEVRAAFRETMRRKKERMEENLKRMEELELQGFFA